MGGKSVKRKKEQNPDAFQNDRKASNFFQMILAWFIIPLIFAVAVLLIIAKVADVDVMEKTKQWSSSLSVSEEPNEKQSTKKDDKILEERVLALKEELKQKEQQLLDVQGSLKKSNDEKEKLVLAQEKLQAEIKVLEQTTDETKKDTGQLVTTFEKMSAKSAAPVITEMKDVQALEILSQMKADTLASILEKMTPEDAAKYTALLAK